MKLLIGSYTKTTEEGLALYEVDVRDKRAKLWSQLNIDNPSFFTSSGPDAIYAVTENEDGSSFVNSIRLIDGNLSLKEKIMIKGKAPCNIITDNSLKHLITANYASGSADIISIDPSDHLILSQYIRFDNSGPDKERQASSHIHCACISPDSRYIFFTDLGGDCLCRYNIGDGKYLISEETLKKFDIYPGSGPRHILFHPSGDYLYIINELSGTIMAFTYNNGEIELLKTVLPKEYANGSGGDIAISADGDHLYVSYRDSNDGIAILRTGNSTEIEQIGYTETARHPRKISLSDNGEYLFSACMEDNRVEIYNVNSDNGSLKFSGLSIEIDSPACVKEI